MVETVQIATPESTASTSPAGHDAAMLAKAETAGVVVQGEATQPAEQALLLGKFKTADDLAKAYQELEKKLGQPKDAAPATTQEPAPDAAKPTDPLSIPEAEAQKTVEAAGIDYGALMDEFVEKGALSEDSYKLLVEKAGIPRDLVDGYIEGAVLRAERDKSAVVAAGGGEAAVQTMIQWAVNGLTPSEKAAFNGAMNSRDAEQAKLAMAGLKSRYESVNGRQPTLMQGAAQAPASGDTFRSTAELVQAMADPRYKKDPAYRSDIEARLARSNIL